jgi:hypothetical protein
MKRIAFLILMCGVASHAQTIIPSQIRPGSNGQVLTTTNGVTAWGTFTGGGMIWPTGGAGVPFYSGSDSWGTTLGTVGAGSIVLAPSASTTVNGQTCSLGSNCTVTASATEVTVETTSVSGGASGFVLTDNAGVLGNIAASTTVNGQTCSLGGSCTISSGSGTINNAAEFSIPVYSNTGNSNVLSGSGMSFDGSTFMVSSGGKLGKFYSSRPICI